MIPDRATLQTGVGGIPEAVLECLRNHRGLGIHTEIFSDCLQPLIERGAEDNAHKTPHPRKAVASFALGTRALYRHIHDNPLFEFRPCRHTNDPEVIARNGRMAAVNSALEVNLSGQVRQDSVAGVPFSGAGGQADSIREAARAPRRAGDRPARHGPGRGAARRRASCRGSSPVRAWSPRAPMCAGSSPSSAPSTCTA